MTSIPDQPVSPSVDTRAGGEITLLLADDHDIVREGLRALLEMAGDLTVVGEARTGTEAVSEAERLRPQIVLMDITMPGLDGVEACRRIRQRLPKTLVLFLTMHEADDYFFRALRAGASGYVIKRSAAADLIAAIRAVARGESFLSPGVAHTLVENYAARVDRADEGASDGTRSPAPVRDRYETLTSREREIFQLVAEGHTNLAIAHRLGLSAKTVETHRASVMNKLELRDVTHLVRYAVHRGLVNSER
jgi:two-component system, NarL family, response regulator NreC